MDFFRQRSEMNCTRFSSPEGHSLMEQNIGLAWQTEKRRGPLLGITLGLTLSSSQHGEKSSQLDWMMMPIVLPWQMSISTSGLTSLAPLKEMSSATLPSTSILADHHFTMLQNLTAATSTGTFLATTYPMMTLWQPVNHMVKVLGW